MKQRSCGMRIAVTEREAICFNAKRAIKEVHGNEHEAVKLRNANCVTEREAICFNAKRTKKKSTEMTFLKKCEFYDKLQQLCYTKTK